MTHVRPTSMAGGGAWQAGRQEELDVGGGGWCPPNVSDPFVKTMMCSKNGEQKAESNRARKPSFPSLLLGRTC